MKINGRPYTTIWLDEAGIVEIIDQTQLPHAFVTLKLGTLDAVVDAIVSMKVRGAPLIGAAAAYGICVALKADCASASLDHAYQVLLATRPTAVNLRWALDEMRGALLSHPVEDWLAVAYQCAAQICQREVDASDQIGQAGLAVIQALADARAAKGPLNILTHCNAGWLATVDWGTALAPIYQAFDAGIPVHVWVDETRPRNQGASLTAWELGQQGVPHTVIADNVGGHLMQHGLVDLCIVGADRVTAQGDAANKIGTYLKALAAKDNDVPFYVAMPSSTIDWGLSDGVKEIPIEQRGGEELTHIAGRTAEGEIVTVQVTPEGSRAVNYGFDVTPARLITGLITERGVCLASVEGLAQLFPQKSEQVSETIRS